MKNKQAITLIELIVVITILTILGTIAFLSFQSYTIQSRDSVRITDLNSIKTVLEYDKIKTGGYVAPDGGVSITYSGAMVWTQGTFGVKARKGTRDLSVIPTDPLTENEYTYSVLNTGKEYELGAILEGNEVSSTLTIPYLTSPKGRGITEETYADSSSFKSYITGNYNGKVAKVSTGSTDYILAIPSIISSDITTSLKLTDIITNKKLSVKSYKNIPHSYGIETTPIDDADLKFVKPANLVVFSGSINTLKSSDSEQLTLIENIQKSYSGTQIQSISPIQDLFDISKNDNYKAQTLLLALDPSFNITADLTPESIAPTCLEMTDYHIGKLNTFFSGTSYHGDATYWCGLTSIDASGQGLTGSIPLEIGNLTNLLTLSLWNNQITGTIPNTIGDLFKLRYLYLDNLNIPLFFKTT